MSNILNRLNFILTRPEKNKMTILLFGTIILALLETFSIGIVIPIMHLFVNQEKIHTSRILRIFYKLTGSQDNVTFLIILIVTAIALFTIKAVYTIYMRYKEKAAINNIFVRLTTKLLTSYLDRAYSFHLENNSAILFRNVATSVTQFCSSFLYALMSIVAETLILVSIFSLLVFIYPAITLLLSAVIGLAMLFINFFLKKRIKRYSQERMQSAEDMHKFGLEALHAVKEIKVYNAQGFFIKRYSEASKKRGESLVMFHVVSILPRSVLEFILFVSVLTALLIGVYLNKPPAALIPMMAALGFAAIRVLPSINKVYSHINTARYYTDSLDIVYNSLKEKELEEKRGDAAQVDVRLREESHDIRLERVEFCYSRAPQPIFKQFDLVIPKHKTVAFSGETGAGKSTLVDILMGLLMPKSGTLYYGDTPIGPGNILEYRKKVGYVPQHIFLIDSTIESNIAFGVPARNIDAGHLNYVIKISQLKSLIDDLPEGIKTLVGERGIRLSGGQRQRVAIARALYRNPEILIMDEATSALDGHTESEITRALKNLCGKLTIIIIAHRLSTIEHADIIYVMENGRITEKGTYSELLEKSRVFQRMAKKAMEV